MRYGICERLRRVDRAIRRQMAQKTHEALQEAAVSLPLRGLLELRKET